MKILFFFVCWSIVSCFGQEAKTVAMEFSIQAVPQDFFSTFQFSYQKKRFMGKVGLGLGINRTFFQQRLYPSGQLSGAFFLLQKPSCQLGVSALIQAQSVKQLASSTHINNQFFTGLGYQLDWGRKIRFTHALHVGSQIENYFNTYLEKKSNIVFASYSFQLGIKYAF